MPVHPTIRRLALETPIGRGLLVVPRLVKAFRSSMRPILQAPVWAYESREYTDLTYNLSERSRHAMIGAASVVSGASLAEISAYADELDRCDDLRDLVADQHRVGRRRWSSDGEFRPGRRLLYYLLVRSLKPKHIVEAGVDIGVGASIICRAIHENGEGNYTGIERDLDQPCSVYENYRYKIGCIRRLDAISAMQTLDATVDLFVHDTTPEQGHVRALLAAVPFAPGAVIETTWATPEIFDYAKKAGKRFLQVRDEPLRHWYPGAQLGLIF